MATTITTWDDPRPLDPPEPYDHEQEEWQPCWWIADAAGHEDYCGTADELNDTLPLYITAGTNFTVKLEEREEL